MNAQDRAHGVLAANVYLAKGKRQYARGVLRALREDIVMRWKVFPMSKNEGKEE